MSEAAKLTYRQREMLTAPDSRMNAYYYSFERTGVPEVDAILSALAWAGKGMHSTQDWGDAEYNLGYGPFDAGLSYVDVIQAAANEAAERIRALAAAVPSTDEWEYGVVGPTGRMVNNGDYTVQQTHRRRKAGPWEPVPSTTEQEHDPRCISLTDSEFNGSCDCRTLRMIDAHEPTEQEEP